MASAFQSAARRTLDGGSPACVAKEEEVNEDSLGQSCQIAEELSMPFPRVQAIGAKLLLCAAALASCSGTTGWRTAWNEDGTIDVEHTGFFAYGYKIPLRGEDLCRQYYQNGRCAAFGRVENGAERGFWMYWHENGQIAAQGMWRNGLPQGFWTHWHSNGQKAAEGTYVDGLRQSDWTVWHPDGTIDVRRSGSKDAAMR
jgi:hypothetical protein